MRKVVERRKQVDQIEVRAGAEAGAVLVAEAVAVVGKSFYLFWGGPSESINFDFSDFFCEIFPVTTSYFMDLFNFDFQ